MASTPANIYRLCLPRKSQTLAWNPYASHLDGSLLARTAYLSGVFQEMEQQLVRRDLTFYITPSLRTLPSYGTDVVAVIQNDETARIPLYFHRVLATFKCYGTCQCWPTSFSLTRESLLAHAKFLRDATYRLPGQLHAAWRRRVQDDLPPIHTIPLGYANQVDVPSKPFAQRENDLFFAGSVRHRNYPAWSLRRWLKTPKDLARRRMLAAVEESRHSLRDLRAVVQLQPNYRRSINAPAASYSQEMMNSKICLVPRGTSSETHRFYEAMRCGCVTIAEPLPAHWFYANAPAVWITDWSDLPRMLESLLQDAEKMRALHIAALAWWQEFASEAAVGRYLASQLNALLPAPARESERSVLYS